LSRRGCGAASCIEELQANIRRISAAVVWTCASLATIGVPIARALDLQQPIVQLYHSGWTAKDGLAGMNMALAQTADGYLWVGTTQGLYRFNGISFEQYQPEVQALRALKAGAAGYMLKTSLRTDLVDAIRAVHQGQRRIPPEIAKELAEHVTDDILTEREIEVLRRVSAGRSNKRVADQLNLTEATVKAHMKNILSKLGANDRTHAVTIALKRGFLS
jgi:DNA-binding CsgD family transcriptional regulator